MVIPFIFGIHGQGANIRHLRGLSLGYISVSLAMKSVTWLMCTSLSALSEADRSLGTLASDTEFFNQIQIVLTASTGNVL
jgi:hypothetical protein